MMSSDLRPGILLFNRRRFFEAHEALEEVWLKCRGKEKRFVQALIQLAVAMHHHAKGNQAGARSLLARAEQKLAEYPGRYGGVNVAGLRAALRPWREALARDEAAPRYPRVKLAAGATIRRA